MSAPLAEIEQLMAVDGEVWNVITQLIDQFAPQAPSLFFSLAPMPGGGKQKAEHALFISAQRVDRADIFFTLGDISSYGSVSAAILTALTARYPDLRYDSRASRNRESGKTVAMGSNIWHLNDETSK